MSNLPPEAAPELTGQTVLVTGAAGQLGTCLLAALRRAGAIPVGLGSRPGNGIDVVADITDPAAVADAVERARPAIVVHGAAYTDVDGCERDPERAMRVNGDGARNVARAAANAGAWCIAVGTDFVFAGDGGAPYDEAAEPAPISMYGESKLAGERAVLEIDPAFAVARTAWVWGGAGKHFPRTVLTMLRDRGGMTVVTDEVGNPTHAADLADAIVELAARRPAGIFHLTNEGATSRFALGQAVAAAAGLNPDLVRPTTTAEFLKVYPLPAKRPANSTLANTRARALGISLRPWEDAVAQYVPALARSMHIASVPDEPAPVERTAHD